MRGERGWRKIAQSNRMCYGEVLHFLVQRSTIWKNVLQLAQSKRMFLRGLILNEVRKPRQRRLGGFDNWRGSETSPAVTKTLYTLL